MKKLFLLIILLLSVLNIYAQPTVVPAKIRALDVGVYDAKKVVKSGYKVYYDEEAEKEFEKVLAADKELNKLFIQELVDNDGNTYYVRERQVYEYCPELGIIVEGGGHGYVSVFDLNTKKEICAGSPASIIYSPSGKYRFSGLMNDGMHYYLEEKVDGEYVCLGLAFPYHWANNAVSGFYWHDDKAIYCLKEARRNDDSIYWKGYSITFTF